MKVNMNIMKKSMTGAFLALAAVSTGNIEPMDCLLYTSPSPRD